MDEVDRAQQNSEVYQDAAMKSHRVKCNASRDTLHASRPTCEDCGKRIPAARRKVKPDADRCIECQKIYERGENT